MNTGFGADADHSLRFQRLLDSIDGLPERDIRSVRDLVDVGEWQVALENLCTQLYEYEVAVGPDQMREIADLGRDVGVDQDYWAILGPGQEIPDASGGQQVGEWGDDRG